MASVLAESRYHTTMRHPLKLHPDSRSNAASAITVAVKRQGPEAIELHYVVEGDISRVAIPPRAAESRHVDELWKHTCFEVFLSEPAGAGYVEFNFSPSTEYAGYSFTGYREGMTGMPFSRPDVNFSCSATRLDLHATVWLGRTSLNPGGSLHLGVSAIIEETDGTKSWWALAHPQGKPDFHHIDSFALPLAPETT